MKKQQYFEFVEKLHTEMMTLVRAKNTDYTSGSDDALANFKVSEELGVDPLVGLNIRLLDKIQRLKSYSVSGKLAVPEEGIADVYKDLIGYSWLALAMIHERDKDKQVLWV